MRRIEFTRTRTVAATGAVALLLGAPSIAYADGEPVSIAVGATAVAPAGHRLAVTIDAASTDPGAEVHVSGQGYVKPAGDDGSVVTLRLVGPDGVALRPGSGRVPLRNPESGALLDTALGDWAVVKATPDGTFRTTFRLPNGRDSSPRFDPDTTYSVQVITGAAGTADLVSSIGTASGTGDTRLVGGRGDAPVAAIPPSVVVTPAPPQPAWRHQLVPAGALAVAAVVVAVLARRRPRTHRAD